MKRIDQKYLDSLDEKASNLDKKMAQRAQELQKINKVFLQHTKKQLDLLIGQKEKMNHRNQVYLNEIKNYTKQFSKFLPQLLQAQERLANAKLQYQRIVQKSNK